MFIIKRNVSFILFISALSLLAGGAAPEITTLIRIFDSAIINTYPSYVCTLSVRSTDPESDNIYYEIQWDLDTNFASALSDTIGPYTSGDTALTTIPASAETLYYWRARATDDPLLLSNWSNWSEVRSFTMDMETNDIYWYQVSGKQFKKCKLKNLKINGDSVIIKEGLDTFALESFEEPGMFPPEGWYVIESKNSWHQVNNRAHTGTYSALVKRHTQGVDSWLITDTIDLSTHYTCSLSFWGMDEKADRYQYHGIWVSTTSQTDTSTFSELAIIPATTDGVWEKSIVDISSYAGESTVYIAWRCKESGGTDWYIDDITINVIGNEGLIITPSISYKDLASENQDRVHWDGVKWKKSHADDSIGVQIEFKSAGVWNLVPDIDLPGNSAGFYDNTSDFCTVDLSVLSTNIYDTLRIKSIFRKPTGKASSNPVLKMWGVGNTDDNITGISEDEEPLNFTLNRIEPNPFTNRTEIRYQLLERSTVSIKVFDIMGRVVATLLNSEKEPGDYVITWRGTNNDGNLLPSGVYLLQMKVENFITTWKVHLIR